MLDTKPLTHHERAVKAARTRWGDPRVVRLDELTGPQRTLVLRLVEAVKSVAAAEVQSPAAAASEGHGNDQPTD